VLRACARSEDFLFNKNLFSIEDQISYSHFPFGKGRKENLCFLKPARAAFACPIYEAGQRRGLCIGRDSRVFQKGKRPLDPTFHLSVEGGFGRMQNGAYFGIFFENSHKKGIEDFVFPLVLRLAGK